MDLSIIRQKALQQYQTSKEWVDEMEDALNRFSPVDIHNILEWGAGFSSSIFLKYAEKVVTIEHNAKYLDDVKNKIKDIDRWTCFVAPTDEFNIHNFNDDNFEHYYSTAPFKCNTKFDITFVDGRSRNECLLSSAYLGHKDTLYMLHDFRRARYSIGRYFFDTVKDNYKGLLLLSRKNNLSSFFDGFLDYFHSERKRHYNFQLNKLDINRNAFSSIIKHYGLKSEGVLEVLEWGTPESSNEILNHLQKEKKEDFSFLSIRHQANNIRYWGKDKSDNIIEIPVLVAGSMNPGGRDPNYNYATAPIYFMKKYNFIYIGNIRRNECLMVAAALIDKSGVVVLHQGKHQHYAIGRYLFDIIDEVGDFQVLRVKNEIGNLFEEFLKIQAIKFPCASIDILTE